LKTMITGTFISPEGKVEEIEKDWKLEDIQEIIGGYIDGLYLGDDFVMYVDEEGLMKNLPVNPIASLVYLTSSNVEEYLVGNAIIFKKGTDGYEKSATLDDVLKESGAHFIKEFIKIMNQEDEESVY
jgi:hypothetical protein